MKKLTKFLTVFLLALLGASNLWAANRTVFLDVSKNWYESSAKFGINAWGNGGAADTKMMTKINDNLYYAIVADNQTKVQFIRFDSKHSSTDFSWSDEWNRIGGNDGISITKSNNYMKVTDWSSGEWKNNTISIKGSPDSWSANLVTLTDNANGTYTGTISNFVAQKSSETYKPTDSQGNWYGSDQNVSMIAGATYDIAFTLTLSSNSVSATATQKTFSVTASSADNNMGTVSPSSAWVGSSAVTFTATPNTGYHWTSWSKTGGASPSNAATSSVTATADGTITANFAANTYTVTLDNKGATTAGSASVTATYDAAMPSATMPTKTGYTFGGYYDADGSTSGNWGTQYYTNAGASAHVWDKTDDATLYAQWTEKLTSVTISSNGNGTVSPTEASVGVATTQSVTATPSTGYHFVSWAVTGNADIKDLTTTNPVTLYGNGSAGTGTLTATFAETTYAITVAAGANGSVASNSVSAGQITPVALPTATPADGYNFKNWTATEGITITNANSAEGATITATKAGTVTANFESAATYSITVATDPAAAFTASSGSADNITLGQSYSISATLAAKGYTFTGWTADPEANASFADKNALSTTVTVNNGSVIVTANAVAKTTPLKLWANDGSENYVEETATYGQNIQVTVPTRTGYDFSGYYTQASSGTQFIKTDGTFAKNVSNWITNYTWSSESSDVKELYAQWTPKTKQVTLSKNFTTGTRTGSDGRAKIEFGSKKLIAAQGQTDIVAPTSSHGFTLLGYALDKDDVTRIADADGNFVKNVPNYTDAEGNWIFADFPQTYTWYAVWKDNRTIVTVTTANTDWGYLKIGNSKQDWGSTVDVSMLDQSNQLVATANDNYNFVKWKLEGGAVLTYGELTDATIKVNGDGTNTTGTATAIFEEDLTTNWRIHLGYDNIPGGWIQTDFSKHEGDAKEKFAYVEATLEANHEYRFKVVKKSPETWYGNNNNEDAPTYWIKGNVSDWEFKTSDGDCYMKTTEAGTYTFKVDYSKTNPRVSVTYPAAQTYTVTISTDGNGSVTPSGEQQVDAITGISVTATPNPGYHFDSWVASDGITTTSNTATTTVKATKAGTLQATFAKNTPIYFKNGITSTWNPEHLYIYLYKDGTYWEGTGDDKQDRGTGSKKDIYNGSCIAGPLEMTHIQNTDIWEYAYDPALNFTTVVFSDQTMLNWEWFANCTAVRRTDFNSCMNMFVLNDATEEWHNPDKDDQSKKTARYFNNGFWRNYNDTKSGFYLHVFQNGSQTTEVEMVASAAGNETYEGIVELSAAQQYPYNFYLGGCNNTNWSNHVEITPERCTGIHYVQYESVDDKTQCTWMTPTSGGKYKFALTYSDDNKMLISVEYPILVEDYRVKIGDPARYSNIIRTTNASGTISLWLPTGTTNLTYQKATVPEGKVVWVNDDTKHPSVTVEHAGVYTMTLAKDGTITNIQPYTGKYYIRTDCAQGGWNEYKTNDNNLMQFTDRNPKFVNNPTDGFNYYYCRWNANASGNVRFVVANDINVCISDTMKADAWLDDGEAMKGMANIRFGWNSNTNALSRAYISGSYNEATYLQILSSDNKIYEYAEEVGQQTVITEKSFVDENDWTYTMDVLADGESRVAVRAQYNGKYQFFVGTGEASTGDVTATEQLLQGGTKQHLRLVYDFKTDRLISGWMPSGTITDDVILNADMLLARVGQGNADQINITTAGVGIKEIKTIYAVLQLDRSKMLSPTVGIKVDDHVFENAIYWFSLPFDVKVNDIFGVDGYGTKWVLQYYDGAKRAKIGFFAETETFWTYLGINDTIKANVGYAVCLDPDYFDSAEDAIWANNRQSVCFYFPSLDKNLHIVESEDTITTHVPQHECTIDRTFADGKKNHKITDTDWNVIGSPAFKNMTGTTEMKINSLYKWNPTDNTYEVAEVKDFTFKSTSAYLVQFHGDIKWKAASVIINAAPRYTYADEKNYTIELQFYYGSQWDRTYIALKDNAQEDFVLNEDLTKMTNSGQPNIYSFAGAYDVAYNGTAFKDQIVNLGVIARKNGSYTFAMPKDFSGSAILVDLESGEATDLNLSNYTVELNKGTYNNRFQLILKVEASTPTNMRNVDSAPDGLEWSVDGKTKKLLINDQIYLINGGRVYNVLGVGE